MRFPKIKLNKRTLSIVSGALFVIGVAVIGLYSKSVPTVRAASNGGEKFASQIASSAHKTIGAVTGMVSWAQMRRMVPAPIPVANNKIPFGVVPSDYTSNTGELSSLQQTLGVKLATVSIFKQFGLPGNDTFDAAGLSYERSQGINVQLAWEPWNPNEGNSQSVDYLKAIVQGTYDDYIRSFGLAIKQYGGPVTLRFGHEMNGDWYPWGMRAADYTAAYRHVHDLVVGVGATNVTWMWCVNETDNPASLDQYYPGNNVVDVIGLDGFNWGTTQNYGGWVSFADIFRPEYQYLTVRYVKPIVIAETGSTEYGGSKAQWVTDMFASLPTQFPKVKALVWFDLLKETDWRIDSSGSSLRAFQTYFKN